MTWDDEVLAELYNGQPLARDRLPYTPELDALVAAYDARTAQRRTHYEVVARLIDRLKHDRPRFGEKGPVRATRSPLRWDDKLLWRLYCQAQAARGGQGLDKMAYTPEFDHLVAAYCAQSGHDRMPLQVFRHLMVLRKAPGRKPKGVVS